MAVVKVIELLGESGESWADASRKVVEEATRTLRGVTSVYIKEFQATVENDRVKNFRVNAKVSFVMERTQDARPNEGGQEGMEREKADKGRGSPA
jgi:flavin-binding protein dodecin